MRKYKNQLEGIKRNEMKDGPSKNWRKMQPIYRHFGGEEGNLDYTEDAAYEMYRFETYGEGDLRIGLFTRDRYNGYAVGKHWMDATVKMWLQDIGDGVLFVHELYKWYPGWHWWLDRVVKKPLIVQFERTWGC